MAATIDNAAAWAAQINNSIINDLTDVTAEQAAQAVAKYRSECDADYIDAFKIGVSPVLDSDDREAIARMIVADRQKAAAAPAMLDALMEVADVLMAYCDDHNSARPTDPTVVLDQVKAAIEQATGVPYYDEDEAESALDAHYREQFDMLAHALRSSAHPVK